MDYEKEKKVSKIIDFRTSSYNSEVNKMDLSNEYVEDLFFQQMKEVTIRSAKQLRSFDEQFSGIAVKNR
jgi:hypothetical protein